MNFEGSAKILQIKTRFCKKEDGTYDHGPFDVDMRLGTVQCGTCGVELNPAFVLAEFARAEDRYLARIERLKRQALEAARTGCTTCEHCDRETRIVKE